MKIIASGKETDKNKKNDIKCHPEKCQIQEWGTNNAASGTSIFFRFLFTPIKDEENGQSLFDLGKML